MMTDNGRSAAEAASGHSAKPEPPISVAVSPQGASVPNAALIERFAEIFYEHDGFYDHNDGYIPTRECPVWVRGGRTAAHCGDCTGHPFSCERCHAEEYYAKAEELIRQLARHGISVAAEAIPTQRAETQQRLRLGSWVARCRQAFAQMLFPKVPHDSH